MKRLLACAALITAIASPAFAALPVGATAPDFIADGALAGKPFKFHLAEALKKGPVVLYFFPAAFTAGCTAEAHEFAEAADDFKKAGATLIGVTAGNTERLAEFSKSECRDKFPVAAVSPTTIKAYDAVLARKPELSDRTSYVIGKNGKVAFVHSDLNPVDHIKLTLKAAQNLQAKK